MLDALLTRPCVVGDVWGMGKDAALGRTRPPAIEKGCVTVEMGRAHALCCHWPGIPGLEIRSGTPQKAY